LLEAALREEELDVLLWWALVDVVVVVVGVVGVVAVMVVVVVAGSGRVCCPDLSQHVIEVIVDLRRRHCSLAPLALLVVLRHTE
jgi:hypothetical protein